MTSGSNRRNKIKVLLAMFFGVIFGSVGNVTLSRGMRCVGKSGFECAHDAIVGALTQPYFIAGVSLMFAFLLLYMASLSWEDLSYVMPLTAGEYVLVTLLAFLLLHEPVTALRWAGSILVATGIVLVARS
jgi:drug/metabolite transporter (DMT)-like permease